MRCSCSVRILKQDTVLLSPLRPCHKRKIQVNVLHRFVYHTLTVISSSCLTNSVTKSVSLSLSSGHICQPVSGGRSVFRLQHWWLQVSGWHDSAYPTQPEVALRLLYCSHQQETTFCVHLLPKGKDEKKRLCEGGMRFTAIKGERLGKKDRLMSISNREAK